MKNRKISLILPLIFVFVILFSSTAAAKTVLHIGDSHVASKGEVSPTAYSKELAKQLTSVGLTVKTYGCDGVVAKEYVTSGNKCGKQIDDLLDEYKPDIVIITLGTNYKTGGNVFNAKTDITLLLSRIQFDKDCYWVGAPKLTKSGFDSTSINNALNTVIGSSCKFIDSIQYTNKNKLGSDGAHYTAGGYQEWAQGVFKAMGLTPVSGTTGAAKQPDTTGAKTSPTLQSAAAATATVSGCTSTATCKQIDDVWKMISSVLGLSSWLGKVWDPVNSISKDYDVYYGISTTGGTTTSTGTKTTTASTPQIDAYIKEAASVFGIDAALIKAIIQHESSFNQHAVSSSGCKGLMQICGWSGYSSVISKYSLSSDPYDAKANIYVGTSIYSGKLNAVKGYCKSGDDELKCTIAAYNAGEGTIQGAANAVGKPASWDNIITKLQDESYQKSSLPSTYYTKSFFDELTNCGALGKVTQRRCKFYKLNGYVLGIFKDYQTYKGTI